MSNQQISEPSMEQILASIRKIMAEEEAQVSSSEAGGDVLDLTDMVAEDGSIVNLKELSEATPLLSSSESRSLSEDSSPSLDLGKVAQNIDPQAQVLNAHLLKEEEISPLDSSPLSSEGAPSLEDSMPSPEMVSDSSFPEVGERKEPKLEVSPPPEEVPLSDSSSLLSDKAVAAGVSAMSSLVQATRQMPKGENRRAADKTIEEVMQDLLRPLLSEWLNANLTGIVEKIVEKEIKKITEKVDDL